LTGADYSDKGATPDTPAAARATKPQMAAPTEPHVRVWAVASYRAGENSQIFGLVSRLPVESAVKRLRYRSIAGAVGIARAVSRVGIDRAASDEVAPPWPDLIVSAGVKNEPVCRWIRAQSGGRTRLVFLGRTWTRRSVFDLVVTTPQYRLPSGPNVVQNLMTQHGITREKLAAARERFAEQFAELPAPRLTVLLGGDSGPFVFGPLAATELAHAINRLLGPRGGSALVTSSARTRGDAIDALEANLKVPVHLHRFRSGAHDNPYLGMLAHADEVVVTSDSIAMLSEAAATGRLVHIFRVRPAGAPGADETAKSRAYALLMRFGPERLSRDLTRFHQAFIAAGHGVWLGDPPHAPRGGAVLEAEQTAARVMALLPRSAP